MIIRPHSTNKIQSPQNKIFFYIYNCIQKKSHTYSSVPNKRSYLNSHTYQNFAQKPLNVPTQISIPIGNLPKHSKSLNSPECAGKWICIVGITL